MQSRHIALLIFLALALCALAGTMAVSANSSMGDVLSFVGISICFAAVAFVSLRVRGNAPVDGYRGVRRSFWVVFASFAAAFAIALLLAVVAMPWVGYRGLLYPLVRRRLL